MCKIMSFPQQRRCFGNMKQAVREGSLTHPPHRAHLWPRAFNWKEPSLWQRSVVAFSLSSSHQHRNTHWKCDNKNPSSIRSNSDNMTDTRKSNQNDSWGNAQIKTILSITWLMDNLVKTELLRSAPLFILIVEGIFFLFLKKEGFSNIIALVNTDSKYYSCSCGSLQVLRDNITPGCRFASTTMGCM